MTKMDDGKAQTLSILRKAIREIEAGYVPEFLAFVYPNANGKLIDNIVGFSGDVLSARKLDELLCEMRTNFQEQVLLQAAGISSDDFDAAEDQFRRDILKAAARANDRLRKDKPITDLRQAQELLAKIMAKDESRDPD